MDAVDSPIIPSIAKLVRDNPGTISLGQGVVNYGPPAQAVAELPALMADGQLNKYQAVGGIASLVDRFRQKLADENHVHCGTESIVMVTAGSNMAFLNSVLAVADPGDEFILPMPFYFNQEMAIRMCGCVPVPVPTHSDWSLDVDALAAAITPRTRAIVTVSPNNPTGAVYSEESLRAVNALCARSGLYHFSDEAYEYFTYGDARHFSPASIPGAQGHTVSFYSMSKNFGMASWRVGYVVFPADLFGAMNKVQDTNLICAPVASQLLALQALQLGREWVHPKVQALAQVRAQVNQALQGRLRGADARPGRIQPGDKVIQTRNNYDKNVFNGDFGVVLGQNEEGTLLIDFDGARVELERGEQGDLHLAYAVSIHKSQGSEFPAVVVPLLRQHSIMLARNLVYTAVTRGRKQVILVGDPTAYAMAVRNASDSRRITGLLPRLRGEE